MATKPKSATLSVVENAETTPDSAQPASPSAVEDDALVAVERAMEELSREQRPLIQRAETRRQRIAQEAREVESLLNDLNQRDALLDRLVQAAKVAIQQQRDDLEEELAVLYHGIVGAPRPAEQRHDA